MSSTVPSPSPSPSNGAFSVRVRRLQSPDLALPRLSVSESSPDVALLSTDFGNVYTGETFRAFFIVAATETVKDVQVKLNMKSLAAEIVLLDSTVIETMNGNDTQEFIFAHEITSPGLYHMICHIDYTEIDSSSKTTFTRVFKFQVQSTFEISTTVSNISNTFLASIELTSLISSPVIVSSIDFIVDRDQDPGSTSSLVIDTSFDGDIIMNQSDKISCTSLLSWHCQGGYFNECIPIPLEGRFRIAWQQLSTGGGGTINSSIVKCFVPDHLYLYAVKAPARVGLETIFTVSLCCGNASEIGRSDLTLEFVNDRLSFLRPVGPLVKTIANLDSGERQVITVDLVGLAPGIHPLNGIRLHCSDSGQNFEFDNICQIEISL
uniref:Uncharacterized protein n=1 Tax=Spongospora subterranea TaxID=70186 RepID=A0A0H5R601_9EUKA|eukprot:CRZ09553.1 hypothetical protein [Spongospora subterranea]